MEIKEVYILDALFVNRERFEIQKHEFAQTSISNLNIEADFYEITRIREDFGGLKVEYKLYKLIKND